MRAREEEGLEGVMLQRSARGAVRLGKELCVHIPSFPTSAGETRGKEREGNQGEKNGKTVGVEEGTFYPSITLLTLNV